MAGHSWGRFRGCSRCVRRTVHEFLPFGDGQGVPLPDVMSDPYEGERARASVFAGDPFHSACFLRLDPSPERLMLDQSSRRPHAPRQTEVGNEPTGGWVTISPESVGCLGVPKIDMMRKRGERVAALQIRHLTESGLQGLPARGVETVGHRLRLMRFGLHDGGLT